ncbi:MAG TPA: polyprenol monophosphomannose synthase [Acidimicrobiales bacterium]|nr:polyprenol monophosphomannose synthase [Acidimicrobiales bacterium]
MPTYQEARNIRVVLAGIRAATDASVVVVDDNSPDGTAEAARRAGEALGGVTVLGRAAKAGLGSAYREGFAWGLDRGYDVLVEMDADLSHDPADLPRLVGALGRGVEVAIGSRYLTAGSLPDWSIHRKALSTLGNRYAGALLGLGVKDATSGFRAYAAGLLRRLDLGGVRAEGYAFQVEMTRLARRAGAQIVEVPIRFVDRSRGRSKMSARIVAEALVLVTWWGVRDRWAPPAPGTRPGVPGGLMGVPDLSGGLPPGDHLGPVVGLRPPTTPAGRR